MKFPMKIAVAVTAILGTLVAVNAANAADAPAQVDEATKECAAAVQSTSTAVGRKYHATGWAHQIQEVHVGDDGVYVCSVFIAASVFGATDKEIWNVSASLGKPSTMRIEGRFAGDAI